MEPPPYYLGELDWAINKRSALMARADYDPNHPNERETGARAGRGRTVATWVFCNRAGDGEGLFDAPLRLVIDARLDPHASVGLHLHERSEEVYYVLEGRLRVTTVGPDGRELTAELGPGDAHAVLHGQAHTCVAGAEGARMLVVDVERR